MIATKLRNSFWVLTVVQIVLMNSQMVWAGKILGSAHDFTQLGWGGQGSEEICVACHTPHNGDSAQAAQLWNHTVTTTSFSMYTSDSFDATSAGQPAGISRLCLSCHDGTVGVDSFGGATGTASISDPDKIVGSDGNLSDDHPISIVYDRALADRDGSLKDPSTAIATIGSGSGKSRTGTIEQVMLTCNAQQVCTVQCSSCHDVHNTFTASKPLLKITRLGSELCLTCHDK